MKYVIILADGMADIPLAEKNNKTPMETACTPNIDSVCSDSIIGLVNTIPKGMDPGSDVANLSVLGYDPRSCYSGRSSIEAASLGIDLGDNDLALRANLVTLDHRGSYDDSVITDHGAGDITSDEAHILIDDLARAFPDERLYKGTSYRHLMVMPDTDNTFVLTPPHDILNRRISAYLPSGTGSKRLLDLMRHSYDILKDHEINKIRMRRGLNPANSLWFWGAGTKMKLDNFKKLHGITGGVISAVDLVKGLGKLSGLRVLEVPGATGTIDTNYEGKLSACLEGLDSGLDLIYLHIEAPDECGHKGDYEEKTRAIELIDEKIIGPLLKKCTCRLMVLPDHPTPVSLRTHTNAPVPLFIYDPLKKHKGSDSFSEASASLSGLYIDEGHALMDYFLWAE